MIKKFILVFVVALFLSCQLKAQVTIGCNKKPYKSAILDLKNNSADSTKSTKALVVPRVEDTLSVADPIVAMLVYDMEAGYLKAYEVRADGTVTGWWKENRCPVGTSTSVLAGTITGLSAGTVQQGSTIITNAGSPNVVIPNNTAVSGMTATVPYTGGNGGSFEAQDIASYTVSGLTAHIDAGTFASGNGELTFTITGTPNNIATKNKNAKFDLTIGGQTMVKVIKIKVSN